MTERGRSQVENYQVSDLQIGIRVSEVLEISATSDINFESQSTFSLDNSLTPRESDIKNSQISIKQVSGSQVGYFEQVPPASSIQFDSNGHLSLRSIFKGETAQVQFESNGIAGVDVYIDGQTSEVGFISEGTIGVDKDIFTSNQIELITSGELELIILFTNKSCLIGVKNVESDLIGIIERCGLK